MSELLQPPKKRQKHDDIPLEGVDQLKSTIWNSDDTNTAEVQEMLQTYPAVASRTMKDFIRTSDHRSVVKLLRIFPALAKEQFPWHDHLVLPFGFLVEYGAHRNVLVEALAHYPAAISTGKKQKGPGGVYVDTNVLPLHVACIRCCSRDDVEVIQFLVGKYPEAASVKGGDDRLPLWSYIERKCRFVGNVAFDDSPVRMLLDAYPKSIFEDGITSYVIEQDDLMLYLIRHFPELASVRKDNESLLSIYFKCHGDSSSPGILGMLLDANPKGVLECQISASLEFDHIGINCSLPAFELLVDHWVSSKEKSSLLINAGNWFLEDVQILSRLLPSLEEFEVSLSCFDDDAARELMRLLARNQSIKTLHLSQLRLEEDASQEDATQNYGFAFQEFLQNNNTVAYLVVDKVDSADALLSRLYKARRHCLCNLNTLKISAESAPHANQLGQWLVDGVLPEDVQLNIPSVRGSWDPMQANKGSSLRGLTLSFNSYTDSLSDILSGVASNAPNLDSLVVIFETWQAANLTEFIVALASNNQLQYLTLTGVQFDVQRVCEALRGNTSLREVEFFLSAPMSSVTAMSDMLEDVLANSNTTLTDASIGWLEQFTFGGNAAEKLTARSFSCAGVGYYLLLNRFGRRQAWDLDISLESFVALLCQVPKDHRQLIYNNLDENDTINILFGLLRESSIGTWSQQSHG